MALEFLLSALATLKAAEPFRDAAKIEGADRLERQVAALLLQLPEPGEEAKKEKGECPGDPDLVGAGLRFGVCLFRDGWLVVVLVRFPCMKTPRIFIGLLLLFVAARAADADGEKVAGRGLPPAAGHVVDFVKEIKPLLETTCVKCHAKGKAKGDFSLETREAFLKGGESGAAVVPGESAKSSVVDLVAGTDPDEVMPKKGTKWTPEQVGLLRAWIDQQMPWDPAITFAKPEPQNLHPREVALPDAPENNPIDRLLAPYFAAHGIAPPAPVEDRLFLRRASLDTIGLLPSPEQLATFTADAAPDKRETLVRTLLADRRGYTDHWITFWNDLLRNDYAGTGYIDGGRRQISLWLYSALFEDLPYDRFVAQLVNPSAASEGFTRGILWRGNVNAAMSPPMQASQNVSQVFMGVNIKCASCHDSFVNDWALSDAYGLAAVYSDAELELVHCDKPTGKKATPAFLYPALGAIDASAAKPARLQRLAEIMTSRENGRLPRTIVNRLWARLLGRGLVEPLDDMDQPAWNRDLLDWLAEDLVAHKYDLKRTLEIILTSNAYQLPAVESPREKEAFVFRGPLTRRLTAEQFADALSGLSGKWARLPSSLEFDFGHSDANTPQWIWTDEPVALGGQRGAARNAKTQLERAMKSLAAAQTAALAAAEAGGPQIEQARALAEQSAAAASAAQVELKASEDETVGLRHPVVFRKELTLAKKPTRAYATALASQGFSVQVNGKVANPIMRDGSRNGRIVLLDLEPLLIVGKNVIAIEVSSHTEKSMNDAERKKFPGSAEHLNKQSGLAFYLRCKFDDEESLEVTSDATWRARRNPEVKWNSVTLPDDRWALAKALAPGTSPIDEGPGLEPIARNDFANQPVELGPRLAPALSIATHVGEMRASLVASDPLQTALDRPNREQVVPARATAATTLQALELTNGGTLDHQLDTAGTQMAPVAQRDPAAWIDETYRQLLDRPPSDTERAVALEMIGAAPQPTAVADFLWAVVNLPEFQLIN